MRKKKYSSSLVTVKKKRDHSHKTKIDVFVLVTGLYTFSGGRKKPNKLYNLYVPKGMREGREALSLAAGFTDSFNAGI